MQSKNLNLFFLALIFLNFSCTNAPDNSTKPEMTGALNSVDTISHLSETIDVPFTLDFDKTLFSFYDLYSDPSIVSISNVDLNNPNIGIHEVVFTGEISFINSTAYDFSTVYIGDAYIEAKFPNETMKFYLWAVNKNSKDSWLKNSKFVFTLRHSLNDRDIYYFNLFKRTPISTTFNLSFRGINIDKEIPCNYSVDILKKWKDFQIKANLRQH